MASSESAIDQVGLEQHYSSWFENIANDFRSTTLSGLASGYLPPGAKVLDIGCGSGALSVELLRRGIEVISQDASSKMIALCRRYLWANGFSDRNVRQGRIDQIQEREAFDAVVALDVVEHIKDDQQALRDLLRCLKPNGQLIISVPAMDWLYGPKDKAVGHYRRYRKRQLMELIESCGFTIESVRYWNVLGVLPVWFSVKVWKRRLREDFRYAGRSWLKMTLNDLLRVWFQVVENAIRPPLGLTLIIRARPCRRASR